MSATVASRNFRLNVEEAIGFIWRDRDWLSKVALGALFSLFGLVLIGAILVQGYLLVLAERVARAEPTPLPDWDDWGDLLRKGAIGSLVAFVYFLPLILLFCVVYGAFFAFPLALAGASSSGAGGGSGAADAAAILFVLFTTLGYGLVLLVALVIGAILPAAQAQLVLHDADPGSAFRFREVFGFIGRYRGQYAITLLLGYGAIYLASNIGYLACFVGVFATTFIGQLFLMHMIGQLCWHERLSRGDAR